MPVGWSPCIAVRKDILDRALHAGSTVEDLVHMTIATNVARVKVMQHNQIPSGDSIPSAPYQLPRPLGNPLPAHQFLENIDHYTPEASRLPMAIHAQSWDTGDTRYTDEQRFMHSDAIPPWERDHAILSPGLDRRPGIASQMTAV